MKRRSFMHAAVAASLGGGLVAPAARAAARVVRFGQSAGLSGTQSGYAKAVREGILAAFAAANQNEASTGLRFELETLDDAGVPDRSLRNVRQLGDIGTVALLGLTSGSGARASLSAADSMQLAMIGTASGDMGLRNLKNGPAFHVRAGYDVEYERMVRYARDFGLRRVAVVHLADASPADFDAMTRALGSLSISPKMTLALDPVSTSVDNVARELMDAQLDCVLFTAGAVPTARIIDQMMQAKYPGLFYASSLAGQDLIDTLASRKQSCVMSTVVPRPNAIGVNVVTQCGLDLAHVPGARLGMTTLEGYIAGRVAVEVAIKAERAGGVTRARVREAVAGLRSDLGGYKVDFAGSPNGSRFVDLVAIDRRGRLVG